MVKGKGGRVLMGYKKTSVIIGSGIAGMSLAEILSRNGWKVIILEKKDQIGGEASLATQKWFHTGWLYAALYQTDAMMGCFRGMKLFPKVYSNVMPQEYINISFDSEGNVNYAPSEKGWFDGSRVKYIYAINTFDLSFWDKLYWKRYLDLVAFRRLRKLKYVVEPEPCNNLELRELLNRWENSDCGFEKYRLISSTDAKIETRRVMLALLGAFSSDVEIITEADYKLSELNGKTQIKIEGTVHEPDLVVIASGRSIPGHLCEIGAGGLSKMIKSIKSPIIVLKRKLPYPNFIRFTKNLPLTINHMLYSTEDHNSISTVGSYRYYAIDEAPDISPSVEDVCKRMNITLDEVAGYYYGIKTEFTGRLARRYNHAVERVNSNTYLAIAGKFGQFPLLVYDFMNAEGLSGEIKYRNRGEFSPDIIETTIPEKIYQNNRKKNRVNISN